MIATTLVASFQTHAFEFDGIDLNKPYIEVAQAISKLGYAYDDNKDCLRGFCQGTEIFLKINYTDVTRKRMVGQLMVEIPMKNNSCRSLSDVTTLLNVIYHQVQKGEDSITYQVDKDGTELEVRQNGESVFLTYNTPYYKYKGKRK